MTSQPTEPNHIQQTLFAEDFHAPTSQSLEGAKASRRLQGLVSGSNSSQPYAWFDQNTSSWKTYQRSLITEWTLYSENFTRQGTMQNGAVFQAALLGLATKEIDGGLLPTPLASDPDRKANSNREELHFELRWIGRCYRLRQQWIISDSGVQKH
jgi:hypothetical protein